MKHAATTITIKLEIISPGFWLLESFPSRHFVAILAVFCFS
ncbi:Uncharacterized protein APZ42_004168 [Daphnia magna]|uniref:Uncharacterized protein n=1 Tax=Daphnia magna TaxID=35525 RepID=A0A164H867_9CRUS|nr:Uncharacterized protein APZ42_004168 [Daphnia magna]